MLKKIREMLKEEKGFTLVELAIVVVILGILAGVGIQQYGRIQEKAKEAAHLANIRIIKSATQMYYVFEGAELPEIEGDNGTTAQENLETVANAGYLDEVPENPYGNDGDNGGAYGVAVVKTGAEDLGGLYKIIVYVGTKGVNED